MSGAPRVIRLLLELRSKGITDARVLGAIERVPRELFVPATFADQAYENAALPIGEGQTLSQPQIVALMTAALEVTDRMKVLEIGTGSGYQTAVLARLARRVYTVERKPTLLRAAEARLAELGITNYTAREGDGMLGWPEQAPFHRIIVTAAARETPTALVDQLGPDGVMILPVGSTGRDQELLRLRRDGEGMIRESLGAVRFVPLIPNKN